MACRKRRGGRRCAVSAVHSIVLRLTAVLPAGTRSAALGMAAACLGFVAALGGGPAAADILWGVTSGLDPAGAWVGAQIFTVDTETGTVLVRHRYDAADGPGGAPFHGFGDVAVAPDGTVYVTYREGTGYDRLARVDSGTWAFQPVYDFTRLGLTNGPHCVAGSACLGRNPNQVNALTFIGDALYGVTGGGSEAFLLRIDLRGGSVERIVNLGSIGFNADGDLARSPISRMIVFTASELPGRSRLHTVDLGAHRQDGGDEGTPQGWAGLAFDSAGRLWAGQVTSRSLYRIELQEPGHPAHEVFDLSGALLSGITGLDRQPPDPQSAEHMVVGAAAASVPNPKFASFLQHPGKRTSDSKDTRNL